MSKIQINPHDIDALRLRLDGLTLDEIGVKQGVTRERIRQRIKKFVRLGVISTRYHVEITNMEKVLEYLPEYQEKEGEK